MLAVRAVSCHDGVGERRQPFRPRSASSCVVVRLDNLKRRCALASVLERNGEEMSCASVV